MSLTSDGASGIVRLSGGWGGSGVGGGKQFVDQRDPVGRAGGDVEVVEVVGRVVHHAGAGLAVGTIADEEVAARHAFEHEGEVLAAADHRALRVDLFRGEVLARHCQRAGGLLCVVDQYRIAGPPGDLGAHAEALGLQLDQRLGDGKAEADAVLALRGLGGAVPLANVGGRAEFITFSRDGSSTWNPLTWFRSPRYLNPDATLVANKLRSYDVILARRIPTAGIDKNYWNKKGFFSPYFGRRWYGLA